MDARAAWDIGVGLGSVSVTALVYFWNAAKQSGERQALLVALAKQREEDRKAFDDLQAHGANQFLRIFRAIEEIRRRIGNGDRNWTDLTGGG